MVARRALKMIGVKPENPVMRAGVTYDAQKYRNAVRNVMAGLKAGVVRRHAAGRRNPGVVRQKARHGNQHRPRNDRDNQRAWQKRRRHLNTRGTSFHTLADAPGEQQVRLCGPWGPLYKECGSRRKACAPGDPHSQLSCPDWRPGRGGSCRGWITRSWHGRRALKGNWLQCNTCRRSGNEQCRGV